MKLGSYHGLELSLDADSAGLLVTSLALFIRKGRSTMNKLKVFGASCLRV